MDETLVDLFKELNQRINEFRLKNQEVDIDDIVRSCIMIECYLDGFIKEELVEDNTDPTEAMTIDEMGAITSSFFTIPPGHVGPSREMVNYVKKTDKKLLERLSRLSKELENNKNIPYFPNISSLAYGKKIHGKN
jgi:hypothetical protein